MLCVHQEFVKGVSEVCYEYVLCSLRVCYECVITAKIVNKKIGIIFVRAFKRSHQDGFGHYPLQFLDSTPTTNQRGLCLPNSQPIWENHDGNI